jgi:PKD repeat protein
MHGETSSVKRGCRCGLVAVGVLLTLLAVLAPGASAVVVHEPNGRLLGVTPRAGINPASIPGSVAAQHAASPFSSNGNLDYNGGPVLHSSAPYLIFWTPSGESMAAGSESLLERYFTDVAADSGKADDVYGVDRQYTDGAGFADYKQTFSSASQAIVDTQPYPAQDTTNCTDTSSSYPTCVTDAQLQAEVQRLISADGLPTDGSTGASELAQNAPIYFVVLPTDVNVCYSGGTCADNYFCAYHSSFTNGADNVLYAAIPTLILGPGQDPKDCQDDGNSGVQEPNGNLADVVIKYMSHEDNETITDPLMNAWYDDNSGNEDGDNCNANGTNPDAFLPTLGGSESAGTLYDQLINNDQYYIQSEWSNGDVNCEMRPSAGTITPSFLVPAPGSNPVGQPVSFDPSASPVTNPASSATWDFGDGTAQTFNAGGSALAVASHTYAAPGNYTIKLTLVDDRGNLASTSEPITIGSPPNATLTFSPIQPPASSAVSFDGSGSSDPDAGVTITSYAWDFGDGSSGTGATPTHTYARAGAHTVTLTVTNSIGLTSATSGQVTVGSPPNASFMVQTAHPAARVPVSFNGSSSNDPDSGVLITSYAWDFGDGSSGTGATPTHAYASAGTYTVALTVTNSLGLTSASTTKSVVVVRGSRITHVSTRSKKKLRFLLVTVDGPGILTIRSHKFHLARGKTVKVKIVLTKSQKRKLQRAQKLKLKIPIKFTPLIGAPSTKTATITFRP